MENGNMSFFSPSSSLNSFNILPNPSDFNNNRNDLIRSISSSFMEPCHVTSEVAPPSLDVQHASSPLYGGSFFDAQLQPSMDAGEINGRDCSGNTVRDFELPRYISSHVADPCHITLEAPSIVGQNMIPAYGGQNMIPAYGYSPISDVQVPPPISAGQTNGLDAPQYMMRVVQSLRDGFASGSPKQIIQEAPYSMRMQAQAPPSKRAKRGEATDPHSISERNRRERISDGIKFLQQFVPKADTTSKKLDKVSIIDTAINYINHLQLQVKALNESLSGDAAPTVCQNSLQIDTMGMESDEEIKLADLMNSDMASAVRYLEGKGLCLIPISLVNDISAATTQDTTSPTVGRVISTELPKV